jgi:NADH-quinone oxidoreductase subunit F
MHLPPFREDADCPVERARSLMLSAAKSSCGRCVFCREGTLQAAYILADAMEGKSGDGDIELLQELLLNISEAASCGMSRIHARESLDLMGVHEDIFLQHTLRKRCKNLVCKGCYTLHALPSLCQGCGACARLCPKGAIKGDIGLIHVIDDTLCDRCLKCVSVCAAGAIQKAGAVKPECPASPVPVGSFSAGAKRRKRRGQ